MYRTVDSAHHAVHVSARAIGDADHENPTSLVQRVLEITANSLSALGIEDVEADPVWARRIQMVERDADLARPPVVGAVRSCG